MGDLWKGMEHHEGGLGRKCSAESVEYTDVKERVEHPNGESRVECQIRGSIQNDAFFLPLLAFWLASVFFAYNILAMSPSAGYELSS